MFPFFRDENGDPRSERREEDGLPFQNSIGEFIGTGAVRSYQHHPWQVAEGVQELVAGFSGPVVHTVQMVVTDNVVVSRIILTPFHA